MAEVADAKRRDEAAESAETPAKTPGSEQSWRRFLNKKWLAILVAASVVIHGAGFACYHSCARNGPAPPSPEVSLGVFQFHGDAAGAKIATAEFSLHVTLLDHAERAGRQQLAARQFRVQQDVEQLLRQAHDADFEDPNLVELKRQLQEQVNQSLGLKVIGDVIITDLKLTRLDKPALPVAHAGGTSLSAMSPTP